jgi:CHAT domain-containing protein/tetratricopeptide (TPR) repeat protein
VRAGRWCLLALLTLACNGETPPTDTPTTETIPLVRGAVHTRTLTRETPHHFHFTAQSGQFLDLRVEQLGVDVLVLLRDPDGRLLFEVDSPTGAKGWETVLAVTPAAGEYELTVEPLKPDAAGDVVLEVREVRPAGERDRRLAAGAAAFARGERRRLDGAFEQAVAAYRQALPHFEAARARRELALAEWRLGETLVSTGELSRSAPVLARAADRLGELKDHDHQAEALSSLGSVWRRLGEPERALAAQQRALGLYRAAGNRTGEALALNSIGLVHEQTGELQAAIEHYESALALWRQLGDKTSEAATLQNLGGIYSLIGHDAQAFDLLQRVVKIFSGPEKEGQRASALLDLGAAQVLAGQAEAALASYDEALRLARHARLPFTELGARDRRGSALRTLGRFREAAASYEKALAMSRATGSRIWEGYVLANLGWLDLETGEVEPARRRLREAARLLNESGDPNGEIYALVGLSRAERHLAAFPQARRYAENAVRLVEQLRSGLRGKAGRGDFLATRYDAYEELVTLLLELDRREPGAGHARAALEVSERARARNLLDDLTAAQGARQTSEADREPSLRSEIATLDERRQALAAGNPRDPRLPAIEAVLRQRWLELDRLTAQPEARPSFATATAAEIQALAEPGTLFVVYLLAEPASFAWTVDRESVVAHILPGRERIETLTRRLVVALPDSHERAVQGAAERAARDLSQAVLAPLADRLSGRRRLVILSDAALHLVPFAALPAPGGKPGEPAEPLLVRHEISMLPSVTVLQSQRRRLAGRPLAPGAVGVLADAVFSREDKRLSDGNAASARGRSGGGFLPGPFQRLPYTRDEADAILRLVPRGESLLARDFAARRDLVTGGALSRFRIVHFATHGLLHPVLPERSGLVLSQVDEQGRRIDGFLAAPDVAALDLPAELVVLSACQTGLGREVRGEGLVGLTHAFFRAGARRVVVSYWNVQDRATAELMARFYRAHLSEGLPPAAALRAAQLSIRQEPKWRAPSYWAGFSLQGDWR